ncbi:MAG TPA: sigma-70 family RNA polymerase sigma factor, partial [Candidatus Bathyarchaeia archaeon]|nr:sigma-70 family RNA polymerase sigma factor [Candidatus Bathyarchaeia archaeon]
RDAERFDAWLHRLLVNSCYAEARRARRWKGHVRLLDIEPARQPDDLISVEERDRLDRGFRRVPPEQRAVFVFHYYLGLTVPEIAEQLAIPVATAKSRLRYAVSTMRGALEADARTPGLEDRPA